MRDLQLITYCAGRCKAPKALFAAWRVNRMIELAGNPRDYPLVLDGTFHVMREEMQRLVDLAMIRYRLPKGGLPIKVGHAYRDVNGEIRFVVDMPPIHRSNCVIWSDKRGGKPNPESMRLSEFQAWAIEEVIG